TLERPHIFRRRLGTDARRPRLVARVQTPLRDIIVLQTVNGRAVPIAGARERLDIGDVDRGEGRGELDDHAPAARKLDDQQIVDGNDLPCRGRRLGDDVVWGE